jgi:hypothetical protein
MAEDRLGVDVVAVSRMVTGHDEDVGHAERGRRQQLGLQCDPVPVPAGELHDRLDCGAGGGEAARETGQPDGRARVVGDVDGVDPAP